MNWILIGVIILLTQKENYASIYGMANAVPITGSARNINPYIRHWEAANFDRTVLDEAHQEHINQIHRRRKRDLNSQQYEKSNTIKLNFFAHDKVFRLILRQNPISVFANDVEIENTEGPVQYDVSRVYTGSLEDDENSHVHAILTSDNLLDGTIATNTEQYYVEPSHRYSDQLPKAGIHSIVYKLSDVKMMKSVLPSSDITIPIDSIEHCASEKLRKKLLLQNNFNRNQNSDTTTEKTEERIQKQYKQKHEQKQQQHIENHKQQNNIVIVVKNDDGENTTNNKNNNSKNDGGKNLNKIFHKSMVSMSHDRRKRWLPDELADNQNPPLPLDLEVPYNDEMSMFDRTSNINANRNNSGRSTIIIEKAESNFVTSTSKYSNNFNTNNRNSSININKNNNSNSNHFESDLYRRGINGNIIFTKSNRNHNILLNEYNPNGSDLNFNTRSHLINRHHNNILVNNFNSSLTRFNNYFNSNSNSNNNDNENIFNSGSGSTSRPSHKTHVEIITKNGATKKPNIIVNNYNPDVILTSQNFNSHLNLNVRNDLTDMTSARSTSYDKKSTCMLYLQADHTFYQKMGSDEASIEAITRHVQRANAIYRNTDFNGDGKPDNITFMIKRIKVHNMNALKDPTYRFPGNYGVEKFLELFSEEDYDAFCLAYMFTYRDFEMGTLGLAWTGDLKNAGGVCEKNGHYRGSLKSLNTGIVTLLNYGKHVPPAVSHVTLAHEIGHNFGSPHDPEQCTPGGEDGNYIMFARATSGDKRNNNKFSPCSLKAIEPVLNAKARSVKGCFTEPQQSICGNGVVEPGEQCDCGWEEDCKDSCCFPMSRHPRLDEKPCTLTPRAMCSPSQGPCCTSDCSLKFGDKCRDDNGCRDPSFCDGRMPQCPPSINKPNKTICNKEFVCYMGECTGSICLAYGLESCQCLPGPNDPKTKSCELCCKQPGEGNECKSSFEWNEPPYDVPDMFAKPGTPCNDYNGYCDVFQKCREVDPSGPLATLRKLLLSEESIASFKKWFQTNWYTVGLAAAGFVILLVLSMKLLGKRSNKKLKSITIIHSATTETVRLPEDNNGVIVHTAVRTKVPFKKKVRGERSAKTKTGNINKKTIKTKLLVNNATATASATTTTTNAVNTSNGQILTKSKESTKIQKHPVSSSAEVSKKSVRRKNRVSTQIVASVKEQQQNKLNEIKKNKKINKKHKEIIDYSSNSGNHTNTFGKVQKWLLESPIVSQPLSHIEHSSKVRKVISKSQSTPERLIQKSPKKTKSVGNLSNEKVKLQVVYKPPFKFSLKLSKNSAVKTHVIGGTLGRSKKKTARSGEKKSRIGVASLTNANISSSSNNKIGGSKRAALLLRSVDEDCKNLTVNNYETSEHNYETLNPKTNDNPYYENIKLNASANANNTNHTNLSNSNDDQQQLMQQQQSQQKDQDQLIKNDDKIDTSNPSSSKSATFRVNRSASNNNIDRQSAQINKNQQINNTNINYTQNGSTSVTNNPFNIKPSSSHIRKISDNSMNLNCNFGSSQNLLPGVSSSSSQNHFSKSKKRSSLNLKSTIDTDNRNDLNRSNLIHSKRSNSNLNLRRENSSSNMKNNELFQINNNNKINSSRNSIAAVAAATTNSSNINNQSKKLSSSSSASTSSGGSRGSISNIPRASLSNNIITQQTGPAFARQTSLNIEIPQRPEPSLSVNNIHKNTNSNSDSINLSNNTSTTNTTTTNISNLNINYHRPHTASCLETRQFEWPNSKSMIPTTSTANNSGGSGGVSGQYHQQSKHSSSSNNNSNKCIIKDEQQSLPSDLEVMVSSDVENLVS